MAARQTHIQIPERTADEPPATNEQLQFIRQLTSGLSLQGYRFDYRKLGQHQADTIIQQLQAMNDQPPAPAKPRKQGPGCIASIAKGTTALIVWAVVLAGVAGGAYLIWNHIQNNPEPTASSSDQDDNEENADSDTPTNPGDRASGGSSDPDFFGLGSPDSPASPTGSDTSSDPADKTTTNPGTPATSPDAATLPPEARELARQLDSLEVLLVTLSQGTRQTFELDVRTQSSQRMQKALDKMPDALDALNATDPTLSPRIRAIVDAFAGDTVDGPAIREEIKTIRKAIDALQ